MSLGLCQSCGSKEHVQKLMFCENVSYFFERREKIFEGYICSSCMGHIFFIYTKTTVVGTWFGVTGIFLGPIYILSNIYNLIKGYFRFWLEAKIIR